MNFLADESVDRPIVERLRGVVLTRLAGMSSSGEADTVASAIAVHAAELPSAFSVVTPVAVRIRHRSE